MFHGILRAGATATTVNSLYTPDDVAKQLRHSGARTLFTVSAFLERATAATSQHGVRVTETVVLDGAAGHPARADLLAEDAAVLDVGIDPAADLAVLPYSSGTTGNSKGVMLTHATWCCRSSTSTADRADELRALHRGGS